MPKDKIDLRIITPEMSINRDRNSAVFLSGLFGQFELLPNHEDYISLLQIGVIGLKKDKCFVDSFIISNSFLRFDNTLNVCEINTEYFFDIIHQQRVEKDFISHKIQRSSNTKEVEFYNYLLEYYSTTSV